MNYSTAQLGQELGVTAQTVRNWLRWKWITPAYINEKEAALFSEEQVEQFKAALPVPPKPEVKEWLQQFPKPETEVAEPLSFQIIPSVGKFAPKPDPDSKIANLIARSTSLMMESLTHVPCDLDNIADVVKYTQEYFEFCGGLGMMPSKRGLANWMGYSLSALETRVKNNSKTGRFIDQICDAVKNNLEQAALTNAVNNISAIFILKSQYGYVETQKVVVEPSENALGAPKSMEEIAESIDNDIVED